ncbi:MAG: outer membrane lipoprotein carrier protein LolA [Phycisphaerae bacterium]
MQNETVIAILLATITPVLSAANPVRAKEPPKSRATTKPAASRPSSGDRVVDEVLDRLETKGEAIQGLACKLTYRYITIEPVEDRQIKTGTLLFKKAAPGAINSMFRIDFDTMILDGVRSRHVETFAFDGQWLTEFNQKARTVIRRQIVRPGKHVDPFRIGKGPFPMPFGQKRDDILQNFAVTRKHLDVSDPPGSIHLHCVPRPKTELARKYSRVEIYVDRKIELPVRIVTERINDGNRIEVDFQDIDTSAAPAGSRFKIDMPKGAGFEERVEPLPELPRPNTVPNLRR